MDLRQWIVTEHDGRTAGITLRFPSQQRGFLHRSMCSLCLTTHPGSGVSLMTARKTGQSGREGNSVGLYMCTDLACSLYVRGKKAVPSGARFKESLTVEEALRRVRAMARAERREAMYTVYTTDAEGRLRGVLSLRELLAG